MMMSAPSLCPLCGNPVSPETLICSDCKIEVQPLTIYDTMRLAPGTKGLTFDFGASPRESVAESLFEIDEPQLVEKVLASRLNLFIEIFRVLGIETNRCWMAVNTRTDKLIEKELQKRLCEKLSGEASQKIVGDIDLIVGHVKDGDLSFDYLAAFQIKVRKMRALERLSHFSSGEGTGQASFTALMGFDQTILLHFFIREPKPVSGKFAASWNPVINADFKRMMRASYGTIKGRMKRDLYGYAWAGWGQAYGREPGECGGLSSDVVIKPPFRPKMDDADVCLSREKMTRSLIGLLSSELKRRGRPDRLPFIFNLSH